MKLYTINATPVMSESQAKNFPAWDGDLKKFNQSNLADYEESVAGILSNWGIDGFTIYKVKGYWKGEPEVSFKIEIAIDKNFSSVYNVATELRDIYNQDSVMVTEPDNTVKFI